MNQADATRLVNDLFESLGPFMMRFALRGTRSAETAEDLVQEVFLAMYRDLRNDKRIEDPRAWAVGALRNQIYKYARSSRVHREELLSPEYFDCMPAPTWTADESNYTIDFGPESLRVLSPREEEVILLRLQSMKYEEIGKHLGISSKSVCTLLMRAIKKLQVLSQSRAAGVTQNGLKEREVPSAL